MWPSAISAVQASGPGSLTSRVETAFLAVIALAVLCVVGPKLVAWTGAGLSALYGRLRRPRREHWLDSYAPKCRACGYDLRASPEQCPECGTPVEPVDRTMIWYLMRLRAENMDEPMIRRRRVGRETRYRPGV